MRTMQEELEDAEESSEDGSNEDSGISSDKDYQGFTFIQDVTCNLNYKARIPDSWMLMDSQSAVDVFTNSKLLTDICDTKKPHFAALWCWNEHC